MTTERNERRAKMLEKVRKLLAMGRDGRGNEHEEAAAMRQANKIMAEFGIAEAECDMSAIDAGEMEFGEAEFGRDGAAPVQGKVYRSAPTWCGVLGVGVARFTDTIIIRKSTGAGKIYAFQGELQDVQLARWIFGVLVSSIQTEHRASGWTHRGEGAAFKSSAAQALAIRLRDLARERRAMFEQAKAASNSRALVVVNRKAGEIATRFGKQRTKSSSHAGYKATGAVQAGREAGGRINIPSGRPLGNSSRAMLQ